MKSLYYRSRRKRSADFLPEVADFNRRMVAAGGLLSGSSAMAIDDFTRALMEAGLWHKIIDMGPFVGNWAGCMVKLKFPAGVAGTLVNVNFVVPDYMETGAIAGLWGNGTTKYLRTGIIQQTHLGVTGHVACYLREDMATTGVHTVIGASNTDFYGIAQNGAEMRGQFGGTNYANNGTLTKGFFACTRTHGTDLDLYRNGTLVATNTVSTTPANINYEFYVGAENVAGTANNFNNRRFCFYSIGQALSAAEMATFYQLVQGLQTALYRNV